MPVKSFVTYGKYKKNPPKERVQTMTISPPELRSEEPVALRFSPHPLPYQAACHSMDQDVSCLKQGDGPEVLWFLQHPALYTYGIGTEEEHVMMAKATGLPVYPSRRGGQLTFHSPGQRIVYAIMHLRRRNMGVTEYVGLLQHWIVKALHLCGIPCFILPDFVGVWTDLGKVASVGVRISGGISSHGLAINIAHDDQVRGRGFGMITPCGLANRPVVAVQDFNAWIALKDIDEALLETNPFGCSVS